MKETFKQKDVECCVSMKQFAVGIKAGKKWKLKKKHKVLRVNLKKSEGGGDELTTTRNLASSTQ